MTRVGLRKAAWVWWHQWRCGQVLVRIRSANVRVVGLPGQTRLQTTRTLACPRGHERPQ